MDHEAHEDFLLPTGFQSPGGFYFSFNLDSRSHYRVVYDKAIFILVKDGKELFPIRFNKRPKFFSLSASDGTPFSRVTEFSEGCIAGSTMSVTYSNGCALQGKGLDCMYCNINATTRTYAKAEGLKLKSPQKIAEALKSAYALDNVTHVNLTGGYIQEHREMSYYIDVAKAIIQETGSRDFNGTAVIGAPRDLEILDRYKEAGFSSLAMNLELWNPHFFEAIVPGKAQIGNHDHWLRALRHAVDVFGRGHVRSNFVAGIEPKKYTEEGVNTLADLGVIPVAGVWVPSIGSALEGHRTPEPAWHLDLAYKNATALKRNGFTYYDYFNVVAGQGGIIHDILSVEEELLPVFRQTQ
jgi:hypothetical protein